MTLYTIIRSMGNSDDEINENILSRGHGYVKTSLLCITTLPTKKYITPTSVFLFRKQSN